jgi:SAM-dependent methyltransferase
MRRRLFAWGYRLVDPLQRRATARVRRRLLAGLEGRVLEAGCGYGANFPYYPADVRVTAIEVNPHMLAGARAAAARSPAAVEVVRGDAGRLDAPDATFDAYVTALVLCSVPDIARAAAEAFRVLRPGGEARLFEHVRAEGWRLRLQRWLNPAWGLVADGCHLDRDPAAALRGAGFEEVRTESVQGSRGLLPMVLVRARKPV